MLVTKLQNICIELDLEFNYGDYNWQNLQDLRDDVNSSQELEQQKHFLLLWKDRDKGYSDFNVLLSETFTGEFLLVERSDFGEKDYNFKYSNHIAQIESLLNLLAQYFSDCEDWTIIRWKETEVHNQFDTNVDGIKVNFTLKHELN